MKRILSIALLLSALLPAGRVLAETEIRVDSPLSSGESAGIVIIGNDGYRSNGYRCGYRDGYHDRNYPGAYNTGYPGNYYRNGYERGVYRGGYNPYYPGRDYPRGYGRDEYRPYPGNSYRNDYGRGIYQRGVPLNNYNNYRLRMK
ncbi:hypothetical protein V0288_05590 [Pannus brasiliensis CCIBt3594]|uniref:Uncharacterized protein n=1 Tax=Pannus brasiliensis CCIBt3594 TaxID=1427578 RepID=A0AAW9QPC8_9CHRO